MIRDEAEDIPSPDKINLPGLTRDELAAFLETLDVPSRQIRMRVGQLWRWIYVRGEQSFDNMSDIHKDLRLRLSRSASCKRPDIARVDLAKDGCISWELALPPQAGNGPPALVKSIYIPSDERGTLCVSSQIGCTLNCRFCHTGTQPLVRNLTTYEIVSQVIIALDTLKAWLLPASDSSMEPGASKKLGNIVFMGMGEPLYNLDAVCRAHQVLTDAGGLNFSRRKVTVSTAGVAPKLHELGTRTSAQLAISLHAADDELRNRLIPLNRAYGIDELLAACKNYPTLSNSERITFEYVMLRNINDSIEHAMRLVRRLNSIPSKINLIPFNPWPGAPYKCSSDPTIQRFSRYLNNAGFSAPIRTPRGKDILGACGQLKTISIRPEKIRIFNQPDPMSPAHGG